MTSLNKWTPYAPTPRKEDSNTTDKILGQMASEFGEFRRGLDRQTAETIERLANEAIRERLVPQAIRELAASTVETQTAGTVEAARQQAHDELGAAAAREVSRRGQTMQAQMTAQIEQAVTEAVGQAAARAVAQVQDVGERAMLRLERPSDPVERTVTRDSQGLIQSISGGGITKTVIRDINGYITKVVEEPS